MRVLVVLSHLMSSRGVLSDESIARAEYAIKIFRRHNYKFIVTSGWAYRSDYAIPISDVVSAFVCSHSDIQPVEIISDTHARDTVGDAYFLRRLSQVHHFTEMTVVTSDYHVERSEIIFKKILCNTVNVKIIGVDTKNKLNPKILQHEKKSIEAFEYTFKDANFQDISSIHHVMVTKHPFYNGNK